MANNDKNKKQTFGGLLPRPCNTLMWVWGIIAICLVLYIIMNRDEIPRETNWSTVEKMIEAGDVRKIDVINMKTAEVYLKKDAVEKYKKEPEYKYIPS